MRWAVLGLVAVACSLQPRPATATFDEILAVIKYDRARWMETASEAAWAVYANELADAVEGHGFSGAIVPATAPIDDFRDAGQVKRLERMRDKQLVLLDALHERQLAAVLTVGNPGNRGWDRVGPEWPFHRVYTHPAVIGFKFGDEPKDEAALERLRRGYGLLRAAYPGVPVITVFIGEFVGGRTESMPDMLPTYRRWWAALDSEICVVRNYPFRSRNKPRLGLKADYDLDRLYSPAKLAVHPADMARLVESACPGDWALVAQTFGLCRERGRECFWRFPTRDEVAAQANIAAEYGAKWLIAWSYQAHRDGAVALVDDEFEPSLAHDGSRPLDAFRNLPTNARSPDPD